MCLDKSYYFSLSIKTTAELPLIAYNTCQVDGILNKMHFFFIFFSKKHARIFHTTTYFMAVD